MSETLGLELLTLYGDAGSSGCQALYPPPVLDYIALRDRYSSACVLFDASSIIDADPCPLQRTTTCGYVGGGSGSSRFLFFLLAFSFFFYFCSVSISSLTHSALPQLIGRIIFATAARLVSAQSVPTSTQNPLLLAQQLLANAQTRADATAVWRHPSPNNAVSLLLLYQLLSRGEIGSAEGKPYLAALVGHLRALERTNPEVLVGASGTGTSILVWCLLSFDAFAAAERAEEPIVCVLPPYFPFSAY